MQRVTGIGGIFFKAKNPKELQAWYQKHLGLPTTPDGYIVFTASAKIPVYTVWSAMGEDSTYYEPSLKPFMINFRVHDLEALLAVLREEGVEQVDEIQVEEYGKFGWIMDPEGNKIELWEPNDEEFARMNKIK